MSFADYGFAVWETFYVTVLATAFSLVIGLPLGVLLVAGDKDGVLPLPGWLMHLLNIVINILRSVPFLILMICVFPLSRLWRASWKRASVNWTKVWWKPHRAWARPPSRSLPR